DRGALLSYGEAARECAAAPMGRTSSTSQGSGAASSHRHGLRSLDPHGGRDAILELHRMAMLTITSGGGLGTVVDVLDEVLVGRDNASLGIGDTTVSRRHAVIRPIDDRLEVEDLGSVNGTRVNGIRIRAVTRLKDGDVIEIGGTALTVSI